MSVGAQIVTDLLALSASSERSNAQSQFHRSHTIAADTSHTLEPIALHRTICDVVERTKSSISILSADRQADRETPEQSQLTHTQLITQPAVSRLIAIVFVMAVPASESCKQLNPCHKQLLSKCCASLLLQSECRSFCRSNSRIISSNLLSTGLPRVLLPL